MQDPLTSVETADSRGRADGPENPGYGQPTLQSAPPLPHQTDHPSVTELRTQLAVGSYVLGRTTLPEASEMAGVAPEVLERLVTHAQAGPDVDRAAPTTEGPMLSVVVPVLNEEETLPALYDELAPVLDQLGTHEIIFVDDGSTDRSVEIILELRSADPTVKLLRLSRNFGHQAALSAGLDHARGEAVVFMDADLQDPPALLPALVERWHGGYEVVYAVRKKRKEGRTKRACYFMFYRLLKRLADIPMPEDSGDYCLIDRRIADSIRSLPERNRFLRGLRSWVGFRQVGVPYERPARFAGTAKYTIGRLVKLALDGLLAFSSVPLRIASYLGFLTAGAGLLYILAAVFARLFVGRVPAGWTSIIAIVLTVGGVQLLVTGLVGEYVARVYTEAKGRPLYVLRTAHGLDDDVASLRPTPCAIGLSQREDVSHRALPLHASDGEEVRRT